MSKLAQSLRTAVATAAIIALGSAAWSIDFESEDDRVIQLVAGPQDRRTDLRQPADGYDFVAAANRAQSRGW